jgi:protein-S-isoprenylcysteine O-methyltransferase Ste14
MFVFEMGWRNAWVLVLALWVPALVATIVNKDAVRRLVDTSWYPAKTRYAMAACMVTLAACVLYSVGVPLRFETSWFIPGLVLYALGCGGLIATYAVCVQTPVNRPFEKGPYRISRNPLYFFTGAGLFGVSAVSASWVLALLLIPFHVLQHQVILAEERYCGERYGEAYREYANTVPRYFLFF